MKTCTSTIVSRMLGGALAVAMAFAGAAEKQLTLGLNDSLTGPGAVYGLPQANAVKMAAEEINAKGGIKAGADTYKLNVIAYDDKANPTEGTNAVRKLIDRDSAQYIVGFCCSGPTSAVASFIGKEKVLMLVGNAAERSITTLGATNLLRTRPPADFTGAAAGTFVASKGAKNIAVIGKGICFDTGGHNLKPARYMHGMHEDMNGSAVSLGILLSATLLNLPIKIDCWLAIAQNHIGPKAYKQNDVVKSLNGTSIEIIHTDAEGRMVLADTLTLASRLKPDMMMDFATLTGSMATALGDRYSGVISNRPELSCLAVGAGSESGERITAFPFDEDYEEDLESGIADIKQCTLEGGADHIHAARFLNRFIENNVPWLHTDLSSSNRKGGLGAALSEVNGFGVGFGIQVLKKVLQK